MAGKMALEAAIKHGVKKFLKTWGWTPTIRYCDCSCLVDAIVSIDHVTVKKNSFLYVRTGFTSLDGDFHSYHIKNEFFFSVFIVVSLMQ